MTEPVSPGLLLHRLLVLLSWKHNSSVLARGQEKVSSLSPLTGSIFWEASKMTSPKETATALKAACSHRPWIIIIHALPRVSFDIHDLTVLYHHPYFPRKGNWERNSRSNSVSPDFLQYLHIFLAVNMQGAHRLFWWMSYSLATDGKQLSILTHFIAFCTKNSWSCAILGKYKPTTYLCVFLKSGLLPPIVWRLPSHRKAYSHHRLLTTEQFEFPV